MKDLGIAQLAYIAGIVDGEGYIGVQVQERASHARLVVSNTSKHLIFWLGLRTGIGKMRIQPLAPPRRHAYRWLVFRSSDLLDLLVAIEPYLIVKRDQARVAIDFLRSRRRGQGMFAESAKAVLMDLKERV